MSVVIDGSAGMTTAIGAVYNGIQSATAQASTSGTSITFTGIPSWVKRITVMLNRVTVTSGTAMIVQLGTSGGLVTTGYNGQAALISNASNTTRSSVNTNGFRFQTDNVGASVPQQSIGILCLVSGNTWVFSSTGSDYGNGTTGNTYATSGQYALSGTLTQLAITTTSGTDTFNGGSINIIYE